jgi:hypothetical protein
MKQREQTEDKLLMDYLLGKLSPAEETRMEEEYVADPQRQNELVEIEDELVDRYLEGQLSHEERKNVEARFLSSPRGRRKLELARSLIAVAAEVNGTKSVPKSSAGMVLGPFRLFTRFPFRFALAAMVLVLVLVLARSIRNRPGRDHQQMVVKPTPTVTPANNPEEAPQATAIASIVLQPVSREIVRPQEVKLDSGITQLRLQLEVEGNRKSYAVKLLGGGQIKWVGRGLRVQFANSGRTIAILLPATLFKSDEYMVLLSSDQEPATPLAEYSFVVRKD